MDILEILKKIIDKEDEDKKVIGAKLVDLTQEEIAEREALTSKVEEHNIRVNEMDLQKRAIKIDLDRWWLKMRTKYAIDADHIHYDEGKIFVMVPKDEQGGAPAGEEN